MSKSSGILVLLFASLLILCTLFSVTPLSHLSSPILAKFLSFFQHPNEVNAFNNQDHGRPLQYMPPNETMLVDEKDVVVLSQNTFSDFASNNQYVMLNFYAPWCYWSRKLAPDFAAASTMLKGEAVFAKIDATANQTCELANMFNIKWYPTMYFLVGGVQKVFYDGERTGDAIAAWVRQKISTAIQNVTTAEEAESILSEKPVIVMAFLDTLGGPATRELVSVLKLHIDVNFYQTTNVDVARMFDIGPQIKRPTLAMLKKRAINHTRFDFDGQFTSREIDNFVSTYKLSSVLTIKEEQAPSIIKNPMKQLWLFGDTFGLHVIPSFEEAADHFKGKLLFVRVESTRGSTGRIANEFGIHGAGPTLVAYTPNGNNNKHIYRGALIVNRIKAFAEEFLEDKLSSQSSPTMPDKAIKLPLPSHNSYPTRSPY